MLILGRYPGESILIGEGIRIVVLACNRRGVRLGIEAPDSVSIAREEIVVAIANENHRASDAVSHAAWLEALSALPPAVQAPPAGAS